MSCCNQSVHMYQNCLEQSKKHVCNGAYDHYNHVEIKLNSIQAGVFWNHLGWGGTFPPVSPLFVVQLRPNLAWWYSGTKSLKSHKILLPSSPGGTYDVIKPFLVLFHVKIRAPLSILQWSWNLAQGSILRRWFRIRAKKFQINTFWRRKGIFLRKTKLLPKRSLTKVLPWQHPVLLLTENYFKWCPI